ncbi:MAG TPA: head GIN domain-containing protein [Daejeonella sp.]|nr:head GIN domain-containing protein [Daejeonella sp.]
MRRLNLFASSIIAILLLTTTGCSQLGCISGSGNQISKVYSNEPFSLVKTSGSMKVILKEGPQQVRIIADDNIQERIRTRVSNRTLQIDLEGNFCNIGPITVYLSTPEWEGIKASGAVNISSDGKLNTTKDFQIALSGSNNINLDLNAASVFTKSSGSSKVFLTGQAGSHAIDLSGSSTIDALDFVVGKCQIKSSGSTKARINVLNELEIKSSGTSDIVYRGKPTKVVNDNMGISSLKNIN